MQATRSNLQQNNSISPSPVEADSNEANKQACAAGEVSGPRTDSILALMGQVCGCRPRRRSWAENVTPP